MTSHHDESGKACLRAGSVASTHSANDDQGFRLGQKFSSDFLAQRASSAGNHVLTNPNVTQTHVSSGITSVLPTLDLRDKGSRKVKTRGGRNRRENMPFYGRDVDRPMFSYPNLEKSTSRQRSGRVGYGRSPRRTSFLEKQADWIEGRSPVNPMISGEYVAQTVGVNEPSVFYDEDYPSLAKGSTSIAGLRLHQEIAEPIRSVIDPDVTQTADTSIPTQQPETPQGHTEPTSEPPTAIPSSTTAQPVPAEHIESSIATDPLISAMQQMSIGSTSGSGTEQTYAFNGFVYTLEELYKVHPEYAADLFARKAFTRQTALLNERYGGLLQVSNWTRQSLYAFANIDTWTPDLLEFMQNYEYLIRDAAEKSRALELYLLFLNPGHVTATQEAIKQDLLDLQEAIAAYLDMVSVPSLILPTIPPESYYDCARVSQFLNVYIATLPDLMQQALVSVRMSLFDDLWDIARQAALVIELHFSQFPDAASVNQMRKAFYAYASVYRFRVEQLRQRSLEHPRNSDPPQECSVHAVPSQASTTTEKVPQAPSQPISLPQQTEPIPPRATIYPQHQGTPRPSATHSSKPPSSGRRPSGNDDGDGNNDGDTRKTSSAASVSSSDSDSEEARERYLKLLNRPLHFNVFWNGVYPFPCFVGLAIYLKRRADAYGETLFEFATNVEFWSRQAERAYERIYGKTFVPLRAGKDGALSKEDDMLTADRLRRDRQLLSHQTGLSIKEKTNGGNVLETFKDAEARARFQGDWKLRTRISSASSIRRNVYEAFDRVRFDDCGFLSTWDVGSTISRSTSTHLANLSDVEILNTLHPVTFDYYEHHTRLTYAQVQNLIEREKLPFTTIEQASRDIVQGAYNRVYPQEHPREQINFYLFPDMERLRPISPPMTDPDSMRAGLFKLLNTPTGHIVTFEGHEFNEDFGMNLWLRRYADYSDDHIPTQDRDCAVTAFNTICQNVSSRDTKHFFLYGIPLPSHEESILMDIDLLRQRTWDVCTAPNGLEVNETNAMVIFYHAMKNTSLDPIEERDREEVQAAFDRVLRPLDRPYVERIIFYEYNWTELASYVLSQRTAPREHPFAKDPDPVAPTMDDNDAESFFDPDVEQDEADLSRMDTSELPPVLASTSETITSVPPQVQVHDVQSVPPPIVSVPPTATQPFTSATSATPMEVDPTDPSVIPSTSQATTSSAQPTFDPTVPPPKATKAFVPIDQSKLGFVYDTTQGKFKSNPQTPQQPSAQTRPATQPRVPRIVPSAEEQGLFGNKPRQQPTQQPPAQESVIGFAKCGKCEVAHDPKGKCNPADLAKLTKPSSIVPVGPVRRVQTTQYPPLPQQQPAAEGWQKPKPQQTFSTSFAGKALAAGGNAPIPLKRSVFSQTMTAPARPVIRTTSYAPSGMSHAQSGVSFRSASKPYKPSIEETGIRLGNIRAAPPTHQKTELLRTANGADAGSCFAGNRDVDPDLLRTHDGETARLADTIFYTTVFTAANHAIGWADPERNKSALAKKVDFPPIIQFGDRSSKSEFTYHLGDVFKVDALRYLTSATPRQTSRTSLRDCVAAGTDRLCATASARDFRRVEPSPGAVYNRYSLVRFSMNHGGRRENCVRWNLELCSLDSTRVIVANNEHISYKSFETMPRRREVVWTSGTMISSKLPLYELHGCLFPKSILTLVPNARPATFGFRLSVVTFCTKKDQVESFNPDATFNYNTRTEFNAHRWPEADLFACSSAWEMQNIRDQAALTRIPITNGVFLKQYSYGFSLDLSGKRERNLHALAGIRGRVRIFTINDLTETEENICVALVESLNYGEDGKPSTILLRHIVRQGDYDSVLHKWMDTHLDSSKPEQIADFVTTATNDFTQLRLTNEISKTFFEDKLLEKPLFMEQIPVLVADEAAHKKIRFLPRTPIGTSSPYSRVNSVLSGYEIRYVTDWSRESRLKDIKPPYKALCQFNSRFREEVTKLSDWDDDQKQAIQAIAGDFHAVVVLDAYCGTGKSSMIVSAVSATLYREAQLNPSKPYKILIVNPHNKASISIANKFGDLVDAKQFGREQALLVQSPMYPFAAVKANASSFTIMQHATRLLHRKISEEERKLLQAFIDLIKSAKCQAECNIGPVLAIIIAHAKPKVIISTLDSSILHLALRTGTTHVFADEGSRMQEGRLRVLIATSHSVEQLVVAGDPNQLDPFTELPNDPGLIPFGKRSIINCLIDRGMCPVYKLRLNRRSIATLVDGLSTSVTGYADMSAFNADPDWEKEHILRLPPFPMKNYPVILLHVPGAHKRTVTNSIANEAQELVAARLVYHLNETRVILGYASDLDCMVACNYQASASNLLRMTEGVPFTVTSGPMTIESSQSGQALRCIYVVGRSRSSNKDIKSGDFARNDKRVATALGRPVCICYIISDLDYATQDPSSVLAKYILHVNKSTPALDGNVYCDMLDELLVHTKRQIDEQTDEPLYNIKRYGIGVIKRRLITGDNDSDISHIATNRANIASGWRDLASYVEKTPEGYTAPTADPLDAPLSDQPVAEAGEVATEQ